LKICPIFGAHFSSTGNGNIDESEIHKKIRTHPHRVNKTAKGSAKNFQHCPPE